MIIHLKANMYRWTNTSPSIEYCENGRYSCIKSSSGSKYNIPKLNQILHATENNDIEVESVQKLPRNDETETDKKSIIEPKQQIEKDAFSSIDKEHTSGLRLCVEVQKSCEQINSDNMDDMSNWETDFSFSKIELSNALTLNTESQLSCKNKTDVSNDRTDTHGNSNRDAVSKLSVSNETTDAPKNVPEKKIQKYYEEYDDFIQSLSSPLNQTHTQNSESAMLLGILSKPVYTISAKYSPTSEDSKESETTNTSTSSDSSSSESSTSSTSDSSSDSDSSSGDDSVSKSDRQKDKSQC